MRRVKFEIDPEDKGTGVKAISLVDEPAIESNFIAFSKEKPQYVELKLEGYKQVVAGLALIPDKDIIRLSGEEKYIAFFTRDSIERIRDKFHKEQMTSNVNVDHSQDDFINAYLIESFIIDSPERLADVTAKGIKDAVLGAWFVAYKIEDEKVFKEVLDGKLRGFSVEIFVNKISMVKEIKPEATYTIKGEDLIAVIQRVQPKPEVKLKSKGIFERRLKMIESEINN